MSVRRTAAGVLAVLALTFGCASKPTPLTVTWGGSEGTPSCSWEPAKHAVRALLVVTGNPAEPEVLTVQVTAFADENTSDPVGRKTAKFRVPGSIDRRVVVRIPVKRPPHVGEDDVAACGLRHWVVRY